MDDLRTQRLAPRPQPASPPVSLNRGENQGGTQARVEQPTQSKFGKKSGSKKLLNIIVTVVIIVVFLYLISALTPFNIFGVTKTSDSWKAVFLTSGEVYFGHIVNERSEPVVLRDIYYLQVAQSLQQLRQGEIAPDLREAQLQLVKLNSELHGPEDEMRINKDHILYIEDLKEDGRVVQAIEAFTARQ